MSQKVKIFKIFIGRVLTNVILFFVFPENLIDARLTLTSTGTVLSEYRVENVYESAAKLLFLAVNWARSLPSFLQVFEILLNSGERIKSNNF